MKRISPASFLGILALLSSCNHTIEMPFGPSQVMSKSYVQVYVEATSMDGDYKQDCNALRLSIGGSKLNQDNPRFNDIATHFNDYDYNQKVYKGEHLEHTALSTEFSNIEVISDADFSVDLPAGTSLNNVVKLCAISPLKYIQSNYSQFFNWNTDRPNDFQGLSFAAGCDFSNGLSGYYPVDKLLPELTPTDMTLLYGDVLYLKFMMIPEIKSHKITVTMTCGTRSFSTTFDVKFG
ncbi:MAG: hypothetical protein LBN24_00705 [Mediterranea sp.]|jgi:hypothetical protein|nr:hypothetical protein [Mediterranea sp.]